MNTEDPGDAVNWSYQLLLNETTTIDVCKQLAEAKSGIPDHILASIRESHEIAVRHLATLIKQHNVLDIPEGLTSTAHAQAKTACDQSGRPGDIVKKVEMSTAKICESILSNKQLPDMLRLFSQRAVTPGLRDHSRPSVIKT